MWKTLKDKMNNDEIREMADVERWEEFLREQRLRWLGHVERMDKERGPVKVLHTEVHGTKKEDRKKIRKEVPECDMTARGLQRLDAQDRERWQLGCKNQLTPACGEPLLGTRNRKKPFLEQNDDHDNDILYNNNSFKIMMRCEAYVQVLLT